MKKAIFIKNLEGKNESVMQSLYACFPPMEDYEGVSFRYVVISASTVMFSGPETYIFPSDKTGDIVDWGELDGSYRGDLDHLRALTEAGYLLVTELTLLDQFQEVIRMLKDFFCKLFSKGKDHENV